MKATLALAIFTASTSFAQTSIPASGLSAALITKVQQTTFVLDEPDSYCTVSPITKDGYLITALHCVRGCLQAARAGESGRAPSVGLQDLFVSTRSQNVNVVCNDLSIPALKIKGVTVVATGSALAVFDETFTSQFPALFDELKARGFEKKSNDFAILKVQSKVPFVCWPLTPLANAANTEIWALGYPLPNDPKVTPVLSASRGSVYASASESQNYQTSDQAEKKLYLDKLYTDSGVLYSNAVTQFGQSGGPVISADGSLIGVVSGFTVSMTDTHELVAPTTDAILKSLTPALAKILTEKSAACR